MDQHYGQQRGKVLGMACVCRYKTIARDSGNAHTSSVTPGALSSASGKVARQKINLPSYRVLSILPTIRSVSNCLHPYSSHAECVLTRL